MQSALLDAIRREAHTLASDEDIDFLLERIGDASTVLLGEATHGTQEFYRLRAAISRRLIVERSFDAIAVEADWPDALRVSRYLSARTGASADRTIQEALGDFVRFPQWMWRNTEALELFNWLHSHNAGRTTAHAPIGFFGLDLYSLRSSMQAVVRYLAQVDPEAAREARARYSCFDHMAEDPQRYGYATTFGKKKDCEDEVIRQLMDLSSRAQGAIGRSPPEHSDELFYAQQNARVAQNAEAYYRTMYAGREESWNLRDTHMAETLAALREHISQRKGAQAKIIVWAHNSHIGDARATEMGRRGQLNLGQLVREQQPQGGTYLLGFTTHTGSVTAASEWDGPPKHKTVRPSLPDSYENLFHRTGMPRFVLPLGTTSCLHEMRARDLLERAIGVLYLPRSERASHYFESDMASQFDAVLHIDQTHALRPLDADSYTAEPEAPETFPSGL